MSLDKDIEKLFSSKDFSQKEKNKALTVFKELVKLLNKGKVRSAEKKDGIWRVNEWVKKGILLGFRIGNLKDYSIGHFKFYDKHTLPLKPIKLSDNIRQVPGGSSIRNGSYIG